MTAMITPLSWQKRAEQRAQQRSLPYSGALLPKEAESVFLEEEAIIVDVRTQAEIDFVGYVPGATHIEWLCYPDNMLNPLFSETLLSAIPLSLPVLFLCRSAHRSHYAAERAHQLGYYACNILEGFEGDLDPTTQRRNINGWRHADCSWKQH